MRVRSRWVLGLCGLAVSAPAASTAMAQDGPPAAVASSSGGAPVIPLQQATEPAATPGAMPPGPAGMPAAWNGPSTPGPGSAPVVTSAEAAPAPAAHHHHGLLGRRHCVECQRARARAVDGVDPGLPPGYPGGPAMAAGGTIVSGPVVVSEHIVGAADPSPAGYAVVGGPEAEPGHAVVNGGMPGAEPTPIGIARGGLGAPIDPRVAAAMPRSGAGSYDPSVRQTAVPAPPTPMSGPAHDRPHVISHLFGLPILGKRHEQRAEQKREQHAAVAYGDPNEKVTELPASVVYSRK